MPGLVREAHYLVLDGGAVSGTYPLDHPGEQGTAVEVLPDDPVGLRRGIGEPAYRPVLQRRVRGEGKWLRVRVPVLGLQPGIVHCQAVDAGRGPGLEPPEREAQGLQAFRQGGGSVHPVRSALPHDLPHDGPAPEIGAGADHRRPAAPGGSRLGADPGHPPVFRTQLRDLRLLQPQPGLPFQSALHDPLVQFPVRLGTEGVDRRSFPQVQHPVLDAGGVRRLAHLAPQGVQLPHQMALARASYGRIAGHVPHCIQIDGKDHRVQAHAGGRQGGFDPRVACADHGDIAASRLKNHFRSPLSLPADGTTGPCGSFSIPG